MMPKPFFLSALAPGYRFSENCSRRGAQNSPFSTLRTQQPIHSLCLA